MLLPLCENGKNLRTQLKLPYLSWVELSTNQWMSIMVVIRTAYVFQGCPHNYHGIRQKSKPRWFADPDARQLGQIDSDYNKLVPRYHLTRSKIFKDRKVCVPIKSVP